MHTHLSRDFILTRHSLTCVPVDMHGPHMCTCTSMSFHAHILSCTCAHLDTLPFPDDMASVVCVQRPRPHQFALFPHTHIHAHTCSWAHTPITSMFPLALWTPDLLVFLCCSPSESWMTAAASPVTFSWRAPAPSGSWMTALPAPKQKTGPWFSLTSRLTMKVGALVAIPNPF